MSKMKMWNMYFPSDLIAEIKDLVERINAQNYFGSKVTAAQVCRLAIQHGLAEVERKMLGGA